jgi:molybdopterin converting factor small subunit
MNQLQTTITSQAARVQSAVAALEVRIGKLDESARRLECDLHPRLQQLAVDAVTRARSELDTALASTLKEFSARGARELSAQLDSTCGNLKIIQKGIESSASELLRKQVIENLRQFEQTLTEESQRSAERWRRLLAGGLNALVDALGDHFRIDTGTTENS